MSTVNSFDDREIGGMSPWNVAALALMSPGAVAVALGIENPLVRGVAAALAILGLGCVFSVVAGCAFDADRPLAYTRYLVLASAVALGGLAIATISGASSVVEAGDVARYAILAGVFGLAATGGLLIRRVVKHMADPTAGAESADAEPVSTEQLAAGLVVGGGYLMSVGVMLFAPWPASLAGSIGLVALSSGVAMELLHRGGLAMGAWIHGVRAAAMLTAAVAVVGILGHVPVRAVGVPLFGLLGFALLGQRLAKQKRGESA